MILNQSYQTGGYSWQVYYKKSSSQTGNKNIPNDPDSMTPTSEYGIICTTILPINITPKNMSGVAASASAFLVECWKY